MKFILWILQVLLALHTAMGAFWKFTVSAEQTMPSLGSIPDPAWIVLGIAELICVLGLLAPVVKKSLGKWVAPSAGFIAAEMILFCIIHLSSGANDNSSLIYWLTVAALSAFLGIARIKISPHEG